MFVNIYRSHPPNPEFCGLAPPVVLHDLTETTKKAKITVNEVVYFNLSLHKNFSLSFNFFTYAACLM
jgi:hypothetical protein